MSADQVEGLIGLTIILGAVVCVVMAIRADARAQKAHDEWMRRFLDRLYGRLTDDSSR